MNSSYCTCTTPATYSAYSEHWSRFKGSGKELVFLSDISRNPDFDIGVTYTESDVRKQLNFSGEVSKMHHWNTQGNRNIIWFYAHLRMLYYYIQYPTYDYYWFFDDDIRMDDWNEFLAGFDNVDHDFLAYFIFKSARVTSQSDVPVIDDNTFSGQDWFSRFPGDGDILPENTHDLFGSFFPVVRYSREALIKLHQLHNDGYNGWHEGYVPTILNAHNKKLSTIINPDGSSNYFDTKIANIKHKNITIEWKWI